jgi:hypothetical protein
LNQVDIKKAVSEESQGSGEISFLPSRPYQDDYGKTQDISQEDSAYYPEEQQGQEYMGYESQQPSGYDYQGAGIDTGAIMEISEQVFAEKIQKIQGKIDEISNFKVLSESKMESLSERLRKIESMIDRLQLAILEKVGSYGQNLEGIRKEMAMMQDSFGKLADSTVRGYGKKEREIQEQGNQYPSFEPRKAPKKK